MSSLALTPILQAIRTLLSVNTLDNAKKLASTVGLTLIELSGFQIVEHTTKKGKAIRGVVRTDLSYGEAKAIDEYTFKKDGGWFIREKYLTDTQENTPVITQNEPTANVKSDTLVNDKDNGIDTLKTRFKPASKDVRRADKNLSAKDGAKLLKQTLSKLFPDTKFSVVMSRGTGYGSVDVRWTDGASNDLVRVVLNHFEGKGYDGMEDMAIYKNAIDESGNPVGYGLGYVSGHRELSKGFLEKFLSSLPENLKDLATKYNVAVSGSDENAYLINLNENWISSRFNEALSATSTGKYNFGNVPKAEARNQNQEEDADLSLTWTKDSTRKIWRSDNGKIITDESSVVGGKKTAFFAVYQDQEEREHGNNYASGKTLTEAKQLAETDPKPVISEKLQRFIDGIVSNSAVIGGYENFKVQYQYLDWNPYGKNTTDLIRDLKLAGYGKVGAIKQLFEENVVNNFSLIGQTEAERLAEEARIKAIEQQKRDQEEKARLKAQADKELSDFRLTGSSLPSDVAASYGQDDMFVATRGIQQVQGQSIEQELNVNEKAEILEKYGFITEVHGKWKYTTQNGVYPKFTANSKESAVEGAWPYYLKTPQDQLKTKEQKYQDSVQSFNQDMEKRYGSLSNDEISQKIDKISAEIKSLQAVGGREFTGNGTRRTSAATSNEGARQLGEEKMQLEAYLKSRTESQGPLKGQSLNNENAPELAGKDGFMPHPDWRKNKFFARQYARALGLDIAGGILTPIEDIVPKIDAFNLLPTEEREAKLKAATGTEADRENALSIIKNVLNENPTGDFKGLREQALNQLKQKFGKPIDQIYKDIDEFDEIFSKAKRQAFLEYAQKLPIPLSIDAIPYDTAYRAHTWASMKPESRAENFRFGFVESLALLWKSIEQRYNAADDEAKERVKTAFASIVDKYKELQMASLAATSRTANWMVTGPAKFNTRRNEKANNAERVKIEAAYEFISQKAHKILNKALIGDIDNSISSQIIDMEKRISEAKQVQENIKNLNKIFNSKKLTDDEKVKAVMALNIGFDTEEKAKDALKPSPYFAIPNLDANRLYKTSLVNNNANIKRMEEQLASYKARQAVAQTAQASDEEIEIAGVKVELNAQDNRIRLFFDGKPDADTINALKKSAFKWSPSNSAWQRQLTGNAVVAAESILNNLAERTGQEKGKLPRISNQFNSIGSDYSPTEIIELIKSLANKKDDTLAGELAKAIGVQIKKPTPGEFLKGDAVASIKSGQIKPDEKGRRIPSAVNWIREWLQNNQHNGEFIHPQLGVIHLSVGGIKAAMSHKPTDLDIQAIPAIPEALPKSIVLDVSPDDEGKPIENTVIAAPIKIDDIKYHLVMRLRRDTADKTQNPRFYTFAVAVERAENENGHIPSLVAASSAEEVGQARGHDRLSGTSLMTRALSPEDDSGLTGGRSRLLNVLHKALAVNEDPKNFSAWFSNSKVVDASGNPLLVYHGSSSEEVIEKFDRLFLVSKGKKDGLDSIGTWFTDNKDRVTDYGNKKVYAAYIRLVNPLILQSFDELREYWSEVQESNPDKQVQKAYKANNHHGDSTDFVAELSAKYDGIIIKQHGDGEWKNQTAYVVFNSNQIKIMTVEGVKFSDSLNSSFRSNEEVLSIKNMELILFKSGWEKTDNKFEKGSYTISILENAKQDNFFLEILDSGGDFVAEVGSLKNRKIIEVLTVINEYIGDEIYNNAGVFHPLMAHIIDFFEDLGSKKSSDIDTKAHQAATSPHNDLAEPTDAQKLAGNYKTGKININGLAISIENPQGSTRSGVNAEGKEWSNTMQHHYGYINGTEGADGDHLDVFVVPGISEDYQGSVFIIDQVEPLTGDFDEHKIIIGAKSHKAAKEIYLANYDADWQGFGDSTELTMSEFKDWLKNGDLTKPISHEFEDRYNDVGGFNFIPAISFDDTLNAIKALMANKTEDNAQRLAMLTGLRLQQTEPDIDLDMFGEPVNQGFDLFGEPIQDGDESPVEELPRLAVVELPLDKLTLSEDVPQFKSGAESDTGVVEALGGKFDRTGVAPIQVWERTDGRLEIISGRHRTDLARRSGEKTIPAQVHKESEGFTAKQAMMLDAELNIRDGQGKVKDYVDYFTHSEISEDEAERRGLIARSIGQRAFIVASKGSEELKNQHRNEIISDQAAAEIANIAPKNSAMQAVGLRVLQEHKPLNNALNTIRAVQALTREKGQEPDTFDLFGFDDSALKEAEAMARIASRKQRQIAEQLNAIKGAVKNPKLAAKHGVVVENEADALAKVQTMTAQKARWDNWSSHADLLAEVRAELNDSHNNLGVIDGSSSNGWIGVDLDGTLAKFYGWDGIEKIGEPILVMLERVKEWLSFGFDVRIFTARAANPEAIPYIKQWCREHIGQELPITNVKDMYMAQLWDNIAVTIESNTGEIIKSEVEISD